MVRIVRRLVHKLPLSYHILMVQDNSTSEAFLRKLGSRIKYLRTKKGLSQEALAEAAGLDRSYIGCVERGERNISAINIKRIANALNLSPAKLFTNV